jgi:succinate dehydrogenase / fumarate reductase iron-sulfur subunit
MAQRDVDRVQEFRKCIECFLCQDVCHVLRDHHKHDEFIGRASWSTRRTSR